MSEWVRYNSPKLQHIKVQLYKLIAGMKAIMNEAPMVRGLAANKFTKHNTLYA